MSATTTAKQRTEEQILAELISVREQWHKRVEKEGAANLKVGEGAEVARKCKELMAELSAALSEGALPCPICESPPHGHHKTTHPTDVYRVVCTGCGIHADGSTPADAVKVWNQRTAMIAARKATSGAKLLATATDEAKE